MYSTDNKLNYWTSTAIDLNAASLGAMISSLFGYPLDTIKTKMQIFPHLYRNGFDCAKQTIANDGIRGLYLGIMQGMMSEITEKSVLFCAYTSTQMAICKLRKRPKTGLLEDGISGSIAGFWSSLAMCPQEVVKCRLQALSETQLSSQMTDSQLIAKILREEGIRGFYKGLVSTIARQMPGYFFYFGGYSLATRCLKPEKDALELAIAKQILSGGFASLSFWSIVFPLDVIKSRIQVESPKKKMSDVFHQIVVTDGIRGLYRGIGPLLLRAIPVSGVMLASYENIRFYLKQFLNYPVD